MHPKPNPRAPQHSPASPTGEVVGVGLVHVGVGLHVAALETPARADEDEGVIRDHPVHLLPGFEVTHRDRVVDLAGPRDGLGHVDDHSCGRGKALGLSCGVFGGVVREGC